MKEKIALRLLRSKYGTKSKAEIVGRFAQDLGIDLEEEFNKSPVDYIHELENSSDKAYLWSLDCTDQQLLEFSNKVQSAFVEKYNRDPEALHFIRNDVDDVSELSPAEIRERVEPWLNNQNSEDN